MPLADHIVLKRAICRCVVHELQPIEIIEIL